MRIGLRADGSETIGAGHVVRQLSIAQFLIRQEADVFLIGDLKGPQWLKNLVKKQKRLNFVPVANADFRPESIKKLQLNSLLIDSYHLSQIELSKLEGCVEKVGVMLDGPQQELSGSIAFAPAFDRKAEWFAHARKRFAHFYGGPEYFVIREEVAELKSSYSRLAAPNSLAKIVISAGGGQSQEEELILRACLEIQKPIRFDIFFPPSQALLDQIAKSTHEVLVHEKGAAFLDLVAGADLTISSAGSVAAELLYLRTPAIFVPVAPNQFENAHSIRRLGAGKVFWPKLPAFATELSTAVVAVIRGQYPTFSETMLIDVHGSKRISQAMLPFPR